MDNLVLGRMGRRRTSSLSDIEKFNSEKARPETWPELKVIIIRDPRTEKITKNRFMMVYVDS